MEEVLDEGTLDQKKYLGFLVPYPKGSHFLLGTFYPLRGMGPSVWPL